MLTDGDVRAIAGAIADAALEGRRMAGAKASKGDSDSGDDDGGEISFEETPADFEQEPSPVPAAPEATDPVPPTETTEAKPDNG